MEKNNLFNLAKYIKHLRGLTQAGIMDCKKALMFVLKNVHNANLSFDEVIQKAIKWLRENGMAKAATKNIEKIAAEGLTYGGSDTNGAALLELNTQTDFTGKSPATVELAKSILAVVLTAQTDDLESILNSKLPTGQTVNEACLTLSATTGEKIALRRVKYFGFQSDQSAAVYVHNNHRISAMVLFADRVEPDLIRPVAMHLAAMNPRFLDESQVDPQWSATEKAIIEKQLTQENKPIEFIGKIVQGRMAKALAEVLLVSQSFIVNPDQTVGQYIAGLNTKAIAMARFELGEGIEKPTVDFASEVAAQMR